ncbi:hypothetical protein WwAna0568 [Wolbachia endosymbiont of Drosophila ananassae]|nr:hypothetical protein WwAna0568 [Wolbachia endosymbiont of Drosophila ananassae]
MFASNTASFIKLTESRGMKVLQNSKFCNRNSLRQVRSIQLLCR